MDASALNSLLNAAKQGLTLETVIVFVLVVLPIIKKIVDFWKEWQKNRLSEITEAVQCEHIEDITKAHLQKTLATEHFARATGVRWGKELRETVIRFCNDSQDLISFDQCKIAREFLAVHENKLVIKIPFKNKGLRWYSIICCCIAFTVFYLSVFDAFQLLTQADFAALKPLGVALASVFYATLAFSEGISPMICAKKITKQLALQEEKEKAQAKSELPANKAA